MFSPYMKKIVEKKLRITWEINSRGATITSEKLADTGGVSIHYY